MDSDCELKRVVKRKYKDNRRVTYGYLNGELFYMEIMKNWTSRGPLGILGTKLEPITRANNFYFIPKMLKLDRFGLTKSLFWESVDKAEAEAAEAEKEWLDECVSELKEAYGQHFSASNPTGLKRV